MNFQKKKWLLAGLLAVAGGAQANVTTYTDAGAYDAALAAAGLTGAQVVGDFQAAAAANGVTNDQIYGVVDPGSITVGMATFTGLIDGAALGALTQNTYGLAGAFYTHQLFHDYANAFTITFAAPVTAFSFESNVINVFPDPDGESSSKLPFTLSTSAGDVVGAQTTPLYSGNGDLGTAPLAFNAFVFDAPITSLTITVRAQAFDITSFASVTSPVPEPDAVGLVLAGVGVLGLVARRRQLARGV